MSNIDSEISIKETQKLELKILEFIDKVCEENNLNYFLAYGTLIGAIRHKGFIPWDDDIDILIPREDYKELISILKKNPHPYYKIISYDTNVKFTAPLPKMVDTRTRLIQNYGFIEKVNLGVYVDMFILDGAGNSYEEALNTYKESYKLYKKWMSTDTKVFYGPHSKVWWILWMVKHFGDKMHTIRGRLTQLIKHNSKKSFYDYDYVGSLEAGTEEAMKNVWPKKDLIPSSKVDFENLKLNIPNNYDKLLKLEYGDYMTYPPKSEQQPHHKYTLKWDSKYKK